MNFNYLEMPGAFMHIGDRKLIYTLSAAVAHIFNPCVIVHIGVEMGGSLYCSRAGAPDAFLYGVDKTGLGQLRGTPVQKETLNVTCIKGDSLDVWEDFQGPIHFLYIDGDHSYGTVVSDAARWGKLVPTDGFVAFHDCAECSWAPEVNRAIDDVMISGIWEDLGMLGWSRYFRKR